MRIHADVFLEADVFFDYEGSVRGPVIMSKWMCGIIGI